MTVKKKIGIINYIPKYNVGQVVFAISMMNDSGTKYGLEQSAWDRDYARIYKVIINYIGINKTGVTYGLQDLNDDSEWGDTVEEEHISDDKRELFEHLAKKWKL